MEPQKLLSSQTDKQTLFLIILGAVAFFLFIMPWLSSKCDRDAKKITEKLDNTNNLLGKLDQRKCSPQCCKFSQWPLPKAIQPKGPMTEEELKNVIGSNFSCGWGEGGGCVCMTKDDFKYLEDHAGNGISTHSYDMN